MQTDKKIISYQDLPRINRLATKKAEKIVFTSGCYDMLHLGHIIHFNFCRSKGDILVVSIGNDKNVRELKGPNRPIISEGFRARHVAALEYVNYVVISQEMGIMDHNEIVALLKPHIYVVPKTDKFLYQKKQLVETYGGKLITCRRLPPSHLKGGISTTSLEEKLKMLLTEKAK